MNWVYTIVFSGLFFSPVGETGHSGVSFIGPSENVVITQDGHREKIDQSFPLSANGRVRVSNINGSITLESWDRSEVRLEATKIADTKEALDAIELKIDSRADVFSVAVDINRLRRQVVGGWKNVGRNEVQFKLSVPRTAVLDEIETVNGSVSLSGFTNVTKVSTVNGNVTASNLRGSASLETVNGQVKADFDQLDPSGKIALETVNGRAHLEIPSDSNATVKADTLNGSITNDFGLIVRKGKYVGRDLHGRLGSGDTQIKLDSVNGQLSISRRNDGKQPSTVTNLLQGDSRSDENLEIDVAKSKQNTDKINRDIARAARDTARASSEAGVKLAQAEVARILPEIEKIRVESLDKIPPVDVGEIVTKVATTVAAQTDLLVRLADVNWSGSHSFIEKRSNSFPVKGIPKVVVEAKGCSVRVRGWDRPEVKYVITEVGSSSRQSKPVVDETVSDTAIDLKVRNTEAASRDIFFNGDKESVRLEIFVPRRSNLKIVSNGEIRIDGVSGDVELVGVDESIDVRDGEGKLTVSAVDGQIRVIGYAGDVESTTTGGNVFLEGEFSSIEGRSNDGTYVVTLPEAVNADIRSDADSIVLDGIRNVEVLREGHWRIGSGGASFNFNVQDGSVRIRSMASLSGSR